MKISNRTDISDQGFGGPWTEAKLNILESYLDAYTTALKWQSFRLIYIDAFAGTGTIAFADDEQGEAYGFICGSAARALNITDRPFDRLIFVEENPSRSEELAGLRARYPGRDIRIHTADANEYLSNLKENWSQCRGVLFLDPFGTQVKWSTIERIARYEALDTWILFPVSAIARMLPQTRQPEDISGGWAKRLTDVYGDDRWRNLYSESPQYPLFGSTEYERKPGIHGLRKIYKRRLQSLFGDRFLAQSRSLKNSKNSVLFEFIFCVGNPSGIEPAKRIAKHILENL